ncbi:MAG: ComEA family DNA-binding protein [Anaerolineales bacterium]|nr:ComEA family DNA-binding protein [Anaerolineales bacterium]
MKNALYALLGVMAGFVLAGVLVFVSRAPAGQSIILQPAPTAAPIAVHVIGAVPRPGLYEFPEGARVQDAIDAAGGMLAEANVEALNVAALLEDGQQLDIPFNDGSEPAADDTSTFDLPSSATETPTDDSGNNSEETNSDVELVNINTASLEELDTLPGIGPTTAQKIIDYREENGPFATLEDIMNVSGIGPATFEEIQNLITT